MKIYACRCGNLVHFENDRCVVCDARLAFSPERNTIVAFDSEPPDGGRACKNGLDHHACNWLISAKDDQAFCKACRLNQVIPDLSDEEGRMAWVKIEQAKRRLVYTLLSWGLPLESKTQEPVRGLRLER